MSKFKIKLDANEDVKNFVTAASKCDFDIDISYNHILIDAKSMLGVLSLERSNVLTVAMNGMDDSFVEVLHKYQVAS